jgi:hypothetical protein
LQSKVNRRCPHHRRVAIEIDRKRLERLRAAVTSARSFGDASELADLLESWNPESTVSTDNFFEAEDGYPTHKWLDHQVINGLKIDETDDFGMGVHGALMTGELVVGDRLVDEDAPVSPQWLDTGLETDRKFHFASAAHLLAHIDFHSGLDRDAISDVSEALDQGMAHEAELSGHGDLTLDVQQLETELLKKLQDFRRHLEAVARRERYVLTWFAEQTSL